MKYTSLIMFQFLVKYLNKNKSTIVLHCIPAPYMSIEFRNKPKTGRIVPNQEQILPIKCRLIEFLS